MQLIIKITKKQNEKKKSQCFSKKNHSCLCPTLNLSKKLRKLRKYGITRIYVYVCNCAYFMQSLPKLLFEKKQWKFSPPSFIPFKKSAKKYSLKIIWNGMKNENKIFLNLSQWCSVGHFSKTLLNFKIKSEQKKRKKVPSQSPIEPPFENIQSLKDLHFGCHFIKVLEQQRHLLPKIFAVQIASKNALLV